MAFCTVERDGHLIIVTINRPEARNAMHRAATDELDQIWNMYEADPDLRVAILTGAGDRAFCAGYDVRNATERRGAAFLADRHPRGIGGLARRQGMAKPVIAAVNGYALGGGFELALACDLIVAAEAAEFGFPEPRIGFMAVDGGMHRLARQVPLKVAMGILLTGRRIPAREALQIGLVNEVVPLSELLPAARRWAALILECAPLSVQGTKEMTLAGLGLPLAEAMDLLTPTAARAMASEDETEGVTAFREKRAPRWTGR